MQIPLTFPSCNRRGGVERILVESANFLAARNHEVSVLSADFDPDVLDPRIHQQHIPVTFRRSIPRLESYRRHAAQMLTRLFGQSKDTIPAHAAFGVTCPPGGILWVQAVHAEWLKIARSARNFRGRLAQRLNPFHPYILHRERTYYGRRQYRHLLALTPRVKQELIEHYAVPDADITLLPNGYNPAEFHPARRATDRDPVRAKLGLRPDDKLLLFVANELERKGFFPLIHALAALKEPQVHLAAVGRFSLEPHRDLLRKLGIEKQIHAPGPSANVAPWYAAADLFVLPTYYEAWGLVIVEALATGLPVLTSRLAGAAAAVQEPSTGLLLENPRDPAEIKSKLETFLHSQFLAPEKISATVHQYQWQNILLPYETLLAKHCS